MLNLNIDSLALNITSAGGYEHRIRPIAARAAAIFAESLEAYCGERDNVLGSTNLSSVNASPISVDLRTMTDEHAAQRIARSWLDALKLKLM